MCFQSGEEFFFSFSKKIQIEHLYGREGEKFIFQNQLFGLLVVKSKVDFFRNPYRPLRVNMEFNYLFDHQMDLHNLTNCRT